MKQHRKLEQFLTKTPPQSRTDVFDLSREELMSPRDSTHSEDIYSWR